MDFAREVARNLLRRRARNALTAAGLMVGIMALTTMGALAERIDALLAGGEQFFSDHIVVTEAAGRGVAGGLIPAAEATELARIEGVAGAYPTVAILADADGGGAALPDFISASAPGFDRASHYRVRLAAGRALSPGTRGEVVLGRDLAGLLGATVGGVVRLPLRPHDPRPGFVDHPFRVVGINEQTLSQPDSIAYVDLADGQMLLGESLPEAVRPAVDPALVATGISVFGRPGVDLDGLARRINTLVPGLHAIPPTELVQQFRQGALYFTALATGSALLALVIGGLSVVNTMLMAVSERGREIGLKKAVGAHVQDIGGEYLAETVVFGVAGGALGVLAGLVLIAVLGRVAGTGLNLFLVTPRLLGLAAAASLLLGALAGVLPALRAARLDPVQALRGL